jgi:hypothetical protein
MVKTTPRAADNRARSWMSNPKTYAKDTYYIVFSYSANGEEGLRRRPGRLTQIPSESRHLRCRGSTEATFVSSIRAASDGAPR